MKKKYFITTILLLSVIAGGYYFVKNIFSPTQSFIPDGVTSQETVHQERNTQIESLDKGDVVSVEPDFSIAAQDLTIPWDIVFLNDQEILVTQRSGTILRVSLNESQSMQEIIVPQIGNAVRSGEGGLLGMTKHPKFLANGWLYIYQTYRQEDNAVTTNRITRYTLEGNSLINPLVIIDGIPGAVYHDGGRIAFGPDEFLYITTGDATVEDLAQDESSLAGKILRLREDGSIPQDNPFGTAVYSLGHRNPQGLTWDDKGQLWSTEHGRSGISTGMDELNKIVPGSNYGWPIIEGDMLQQGLESPVAHSGPRETWAPASALYWDGSIFFAGLRGESLYEVILDQSRVRTTSIVAHLRSEYGRLRTIVLGPDGYFYLTTSNTDGRATQVGQNDDKIIRINPAVFRE